MNKKQMVKLISSKQFKCLVVFLIIGVVLIVMLQQITPLLQDHSLTYGYITFVVASIFVIVEIADIFQKFMHHEKQGDKLELRRQKGIDVKELNK